MRLYSGIHLPENWDAGSKFIVESEAAVDVEMGFVQNTDGIPWPMSSTPRASHVTKGL